MLSFGIHWLGFNNWYFNNWINLSNNWFFYDWFFNNWLFYNGCGWAKQGCKGIKDSTTTT
jgi:hypothetical protein